MRLTREVKEKIAQEHGKGKAEKNHLDGSLPVQIVGIHTRIEALKGVKNGTAKHQIIKLKRTRSQLISTYRRLDKDASLKLESSLGIIKHHYHQKH
ncbi:hypothetical protein [Entomospira culicis]|uniref:Uncharacterized protein n=1 Tax=Entomospira culicis TaxID=2719989 RepID=A0A968KTY8_9SPIO|nr:hypothetical protein [Entomospira culicis]NIZ18729.1 hypothetical protein [Entomospira culicis]NIZ68944.1 hypothetical protein [Entomospira culicis]WDI37536.1 hypothetical protein PVA46_01745 [Entomospira culicis]WDI39164.1 hypothetical protein PVA47_01750 [Entomospira culicis]